MQSRRRDWWDDDDTEESNAWSHAKSVGKAGSMAFKPIQFVSGGLAEPKLAESKLLPGPGGSNSQPSHGPVPPPASSSAAAGSLASSSTSTAPPSDADPASIPPEPSPPAASQSATILSNFLRREQEYLAQKRVEASVSSAADPSIFGLGYGADPAIHGALARPPPTIDPSMGRFERHTRGFGMKILRMYGFRGALGKHGQGVTLPVIVAVRPKNAGLGSVKEVTNEDFDPVVRAQKLAEEKAAKAAAAAAAVAAAGGAAKARKDDSWKRGSGAGAGGKAGGKRVYRTAAEIAAARLQAHAAAGTADTVGSDVAVGGETVADIARLMASSSLSSHSAASSSSGADAGLSALDDDVTAAFSLLRIGAAPAVPASAAAAAAEGEGWGGAFEKRLLLLADTAEDAVLVAERRREAEAATLERARAAAQAVEAEAEAEAAAARRAAAVAAVLEELGEDMASVDSAVAGSDGIVRLPEAKTVATAAVGMSDADGGIDLTDSPIDLTSSTAQHAPARASVRPSVSPHEATGPAVATLLRLRCLRLTLATLLRRYPLEFTHTEAGSLLDAAALPLLTAFCAAWDPFTPELGSSGAKSGARTAALVGRVSSAAFFSELSAWRSLLTVTQKELRDARSAAGSGVGSGSSKAPGGVLLPSYRALAAADAYGSLLRAALVPHVRALVQSWSPSVCALGDCARVSAKTGGLTSCGHTAALALALGALRPLCGEVLFDGVILGDILVPKIVAEWDEGSPFGTLAPSAPASLPPSADEGKGVCAWWARGYPQPWSWAFMLPLPLHPALTRSSGSSGEGSKPMLPALITSTTVPPIAEAARQALGRWAQRWPVPTVTSAGSREQRNLTAFSANSSGRGGRATGPDDSSIEDAKKDVHVTDTLFGPQGVGKFVAPALLEALCPWITGQPLHSALPRWLSSFAPAPPTGVVGVWPPSQQNAFFDRAITPRLLSVLKSGMVLRGSADFHPYSPEDPSSVPTKSVKLLSAACAWGVVLGAERVSKNVLGAEAMPQICALLYQAALTCSDMLASSAAAAAAAADPDATLRTVASVGQGGCEWLCALRTCLPAPVATAASGAGLWAAAAALVVVPLATTQPKLQSLAGKDKVKAASEAVAEALTDASLAAIAAIEAAALAPSRTVPAVLAHASKGPATQSKGAPVGVRGVGGDRPGVGSEGPRPLLLREVLTRVAESEGLLFAPESRSAAKGAGGKGGGATYRFGEYIRVSIEDGVAWTKDASGVWVPVSVQELVHRAKTYGV